MNEKIPKDLLLGHDQVSTRENPKRRGKVVVLSILAIAWISLSFTTLTGCCRQFSHYVGRPLLSEEQRAERILAEHPLIGMHF